MSVVKLKPFLAQKSSDRRKMDKSRIIIPVYGIDDSMIGVSIDGWKIKTISSAVDSEEIIPGVKNTKLLFQISNYLESESMFVKLSFDPSTISSEKDQQYVVFLKDTDNMEDIKPVMDALRVYKSSLISCWHPMKYYEGLLLPNGQISYLRDPLQFEAPNLSLSKEELAQIDLMIQKRRAKLYPQNVDSMLMFFHIACSTSNRYLAFVMRVTILEMLIQGNAELSFRLKQHVAVLLGRDKAESERIASNVKTLYDARSKFLHEGDAAKVTDEVMKNAYEYSRRVIASLLYLTEDMKTIRKTLEQAGYGDNPYNAAP